MEGQLQNSVVIFFLMQCDPAQSQETLVIYIMTFLPVAAL